MSQAEEWLVPAWPGYWEQEAEECWVVGQIRPASAPHTRHALQTRAALSWKYHPLAHFAALKYHNTIHRARKQELSQSPTHSHSHHNITPPEITEVTSCPCPDVWPVPRHRQCPAPGVWRWHRLTNNDIPPLAPADKSVVPSPWLWQLHHIHDYTPPDCAGTHLGVKDTSRWQSAVTTHTQVIGEL